MGSHGWETRAGRVLAVVLLWGLLGGVLAGSASAAGAVSVSGSARQVDVTGLAPGAGARLLDARGRVVATGRADSLGGLLFRNVAPGRGYRVLTGVPRAASAPVTVHSDAAAPWDPGIYDQPIADDGYQYLTTRDGTKLALTVWPPTKLAGVGGVPFVIPGGVPGYSPPFPTLVEYSGYGYANPHGPVNGIAAVANAMGFAVVDVSMRGTGCSGGAYDFFEPLQNLDGYDVIETIAHQPWVLGHKVGMMGISYGAISQLFTAQLNPPDLEAIAPLSTIDATATTLYPGGILNDGFAVAWAKERQEQAQPAGLGLKGVQPYAESQVAAGDATCRADQALHGEANDLMAKIRANAHYVPKVADPLDPISFVQKIHVPVFLACQFEDEQTGGHCPDLVAHMTGTRQRWFTFTNGAHIDSLDPVTFNHWFDFLELFVNHQAPMLAPGRATMQAAAPVIYDQAMGMSDPQDMTLPADPIQSDPSYDAALSDFEALPRVTVAFDNGAGRSPNGQSAPGDPYPAFVQGFGDLPVPGTRAGVWYLGTQGTMGAAPPLIHGVDTYASQPTALPENDFGTETGGGGLWADSSRWSWDWRQHPAGTSVSYLSGQLTRDLAVVGAGAVHLWVRSASPDVDLMATVSEVDPNGTETFVQNGWQRASERRLARGSNSIFKQASTLLAPIPSELRADVRPMPRGRFVEVVIPLYDEGHLYRAGSRLRLTISAPNGTQPIWGFNHTVPAGRSSAVAVAFSPSRPSALYLPVVPGVSTTTPIPPCHSLRNEPCRVYVASRNRGS